MPEDRPPIDPYPDGPPTRNEISPQATRLRTQMARVFEVAGVGGFEPVRPKPTALSVPEQRRTLILVEDKDTKD
jgi:hypothetical protein